MYFHQFHLTGEVVQPSGFHSLRKLISYIPIANLKEGYFETLNSFGGAFMRFLGDNGHGVLKQMCVSRHCALCIYAEKLSFGSTFNSSEL